MTSSGGGPFDFHNIQEIEDIELKCLNLFASFFIFILFLSSVQMIRKEETNNNT